MANRESSNGCRSEQTVSSLRETDFADSVRLSGLRPRDMDREQRETVGSHQELARLCQPNDRIDGAHQLLPKPNHEASLLSFFWTGWRRSGDLGAVEGQETTRSGGGRCGEGWNLRRGLLRTPVAVLDLCPGG